MYSPSTPADETSPLWYELGRLYAAAAGEGRRATMEGFVVTCLAGASVLLSAPIFGTSWAGPFATLIPLLAGLVSGVGLFGWRRARFIRQRNAVSRTLAALNLDAERPTLAGLGAYYDVQLVLLRSEYESLRNRGTKRALRSARLLESAFGFMPEDPFETGPLNVAPDTREMRALRERWEERLASGLVLGQGPPYMGLGEDLAHRVFPREMNVPTELATRSAYLEISCNLLRERYGKGGMLPENVRGRAEKDLREYRALVRK